MSYSRDNIYAFTDGKSGELEINFCDALCYNHNKVSNCGGHLLSKDDVEVLFDICRRYLEDVR